LFEKFFEHPHHLNWIQLFLNQYWLIHQYNYPVCRAIRKYGSNNLIWKILYSNVPRAELNNLEQEAIKKHNSFGKNGYNCNIGGGQHTGWSPSNHTRDKMSQSKMGNKNSMYGKQHSDATKEKIRVKAMGKNKGELSPNTKLTWSDVNKMRYEYENKIKTIKEISIEYNIHYSSTKNILYYKRWKI